MQMRSRFAPRCRVRGRDRDIVSFEVLDDRWLIAFSKAHVEVELELIILLLLHPHQHLLIERVVQLLARFLNGLPAERPHHSSARHS